MPRCRHSCTSYFGFSSVYETNSSDAVSLKSRIGKTEWKTACRPDLLALLGRDIGLQKPLERTVLDVDQIRDVDDALESWKSPSGVDPN